MPLPDDSTITRFVYREARLIDTGRFKEWHALWTEDARYLVPCNDEDVDTRTHVSIIFDDARRLDERIFRLTNADAHAQEPRSRTTHLLTGVEVDRDGDSADEVHVHAAMAIIDVRKDIQEIYGGRVDYRLRLVDDELRIVEKKVFLTRNNSPLGNLSFLI
jgi:benzoate/toluate 1,2-dioxygenase subunit beta